MTKIKAPQIIWLFLAILASIATIAMHGTQHTHEVNALVDVPLIVVQGLLLYWGGFFTYQTWYGK